MNAVQIFDGLKVKEENGQVMFDAETVAIKVGLTDTKHDVVYVRWARVNQHLKISPQVAKIKRGDWITEQQMYTLAIKTDNQVADEFQNWVTSEVLPSIRQTGTYEMQQSNQQQLMSPTDMMRAQLDLIDEVKSDQAELRADVDDLKENMGLPHTQAQTLLAVRKKHVASLLGGYDSNAYFKMSGKVFARMGRDFKDRFEVPRYDAVPLSRFDEALEYTKCWRLPTNMQLDAQDLNSQMELEV